MSTNISYATYGGIFSKKVPGSVYKPNLKKLNKSKNRSSEQWFDLLEGTREIHLLNIFRGEDAPSRTLDAAARSLRELSDNINSGAVTLDDIPDELDRIITLHKQSNQDFRESARSMHNDLTELSDQLKDEEEVPNFFKRGAIRNWSAHNPILGWFTPGFYLKYVVPDPSQDFQLDALRKMATYSVDTLDDINGLYLHANVTLKEALDDTRSLTTEQDIAEALDTAAQTLKTDMDAVRQAGDAFLKHVQQPTPHPVRKKWDEDKQARRRGILQGLFHKEDRMLSVSTVKGTTRQKENTEAKSMQLEDFWRALRDSNKSPGVTDPKHIAGLIFDMYMLDSSQQAIKAYRRLIRSGGRDRGVTKYKIGQDDIAPRQVLDELNIIYKNQAISEGLDSAKDISLDKHYMEFTQALTEMVELETQRQSPAYFHERHGLELRTKLSIPYEYATEFTQGSFISPAFTDEYIFRPLQDRLLGLRKNDDGVMKPTWRTPFNAVTGGGLTVAALSAVVGLGLMGLGGLGNMVGIDNDLSYSDAHRPQVWLIDGVVNDGVKLATGWTGLRDGEGLALPIYEIAYGGESSTSLTNSFSETSSPGDSEAAPVIVVTQPPAEYKPFDEAPVGLFESDVLDSSTSSSPTENNFNTASTGTTVTQPTVTRSADDGDTDTFKEKPDPLFE